VISALSLSFMVFLWRAKLRAAKALDSATVEADAACSRACIQLSAVLFAGSLAFLLAPALWWVDAAAALALALLIAREGWGMVKAARSEHFTGGCGCGH
jgi:divalent metal cation (Fe/Co/Zn/Cd) transporter